MIGARILRCCLVVALAAVVLSPGITGVTTTLRWVGTYEIDGPLNMRIQNQAIHVRAHVHIEADGSASFEPRDVFVPGTEASAQLNRGQDTTLVLERGRLDLGPQFQEVWVGAWTPDGDTVLLLLRNDVRAEPWAFELRWDTGRARPVTTRGELRGWLRPGPISDDTPIWLEPVDRDAVREVPGREQVDPPRVLARTR